MAQEVITGYTGTRHITPGMDAAVWRGIFGAESCIVPTGNQCAGSMPSINQFVIRDGVVSVQGYLGYGTQTALSVDTCATGARRIDLVCCRYTHDAGTLIDATEYVLIKGTEVLSPNVPAEPTYNTGDLDQGATIVDVPLYKITFEGSTADIDRVAPIAKVGGITQEELDLVLEDYPLKTEVFPLTRTETITLTSKTMAAGQVGSWGISPPAIAGYTPIALVQFNLQGRLAATHITPTILVGVNISGASATITPTVSVLYIRTQ